MNPPEPAALVRMERVIERTKPKQAITAKVPVQQESVRREQARIARWVAAQIVSYSPDGCFGCRRPIVFGAKWIELVNDNGRARFHSDCAPVWRAQQEVAARKAMGLDRGERP